MTLTEHAILAMMLRALSMHIMSGMKYYFLNKYFCFLRGIYIGPLVVIIHVGKGKFRIFTSHQTLIWGPQSRSDCQSGHAAVEGWLADLSVCFSVSS